MPETDMTPEATPRAPEFASAKEWGDAVRDHLERGEALGFVYGGGVDVLEHAGNYVPDEPKAGFHNTMLRGGLSENDADTIRQVVNHFTDKREHAFSSQESSIGLAIVSRSELDHLISPETLEKLDEVPDIDDKAFIVAKYPDDRRAFLVVDEPLAERIKVLAQSTYEPSEVNEAIVSSFTNPETSEFFGATDVNKVGDRYVPVHKQRDNFETTELLTVKKTSGDKTEVKRTIVYKPGRGAETKTVRTIAPEPATKPVSPPTPEPPNDYEDGEFTEVPGTVPPPPTPPEEPIDIDGDTPTTAEAPPPPPPPAPPENLPESKEQEPAPKTFADIQNSILEMDDREFTRDQNGFLINSEAQELINQRKEMWNQAASQGIISPEEISEQVLSEIDGKQTSDAIQSLRTLASELESQYTQSPESEYSLKYAGMIRSAVLGEAAKMVYYSAVREGDFSSKTSEWREGKYGQRYRKYGISNIVNNKYLNPETDTWYAVVDEPLRPGDREPTNTWSDWLGDPSGIASEDLRVEIERFSKFPKVMETYADLREVYLLLANNYSGKEADHYLSLIAERMQRVVEAERTPQPEPQREIPPIRIIAESASNIEIPPTEAEQRDLIRELLDQLESGEYTLAEATPVLSDKLTVLRSKERALHPSVAKELKTRLTIHDISTLFRRTGGVIQAEKEGELGLVDAVNVIQGLRRPIDRDVMDTFFNNRMEGLDTAEAWNVLQDAYYRYAGVIRHMNIDILYDAMEAHIGGPVDDAVFERIRDELIRGNFKRSINRRRIPREFRSLDFNAIKFFDTEGLELRDDQKDLGEVPTNFLIDSDTNRRGAVKQFLLDVIMRSGVVQSDEQAKQSLDLAEKMHLCLFETNQVNQGAQRGRDEPAEIFGLGGRRIANAKAGGRPHGPDITLFRIAGFGESFARGFNSDPENKPGFQDPIYSDVITEKIPTMNDGLWETYGTIGLIRLKAVRDALMWVEPKPGEVNIAWLSKNVAAFDSAEKTLRLGNNEKVTPGILREIFVLGLLDVALANNVSLNWTDTDFKRLETALTSPLSIATGIGPFLTHRQMDRIERKLANKGLGYHWRVGSTKRRGR